MGYITQIATGAMVSLTDADGIPRISLFTATTALAMVAGIGVYVPHVIKYDTSFVLSGNYIHLVILAKVFAIFLLFVWLYLVITSVLSGLRFVFWHGGAALFRVLLLCVWLQCIYYFWTANASTSEIYTRVCKGVAETPIRDVVCRNLEIFIRAEAEYLSVRYWAGTALAWLSKFLLTSV